MQQQTRVLAEAVEVFRLDAAGGGAALADPAMPLLERENEGEKNPAAMLAQK